MDRNSNLDLLRVISMINIVFLHVVAFYSTSAPFDSGEFVSWFIKTLNYSLFWSVPLFLMLSGSLLLNKFHEPTSVFYAKRLHKVLIPTAFWSFVYLIYLYFERDFSLFNIIGALLKGKPYYHLWFMFAIIGIYLFTPYLRVLVQNLHQPQLKHLILLIFIFVFGNNYIGWYFHNQENIFSQFISYIGYFLLGYYLMNDKEKLLRFKSYYLPLFILSTLLVSLATVIEKDIYHIGVPTNARWTPFVFIESVSLFLYFITRDIRIKHSDTLKKAAGYSFGIYLIHPAIIELFSTRLTLPLIEYLPIYFMLILIICYGAVFILHKIKYLNKIV
ncbi:acyltransferase family protein [Sulfuricurvum sp.]|uniref:acyltransferase n=1 Tax=Sulfuricurvum sp. TaxID=2025608 RepID=UPI00260EE42E|nr:acyltransferase family protein [Sulfuricurvum sp.]MDD3597076.1 acyltransferase family protein [Sulfuricurvum sp.]